ncbi:GIY-YIG nuclease family protein [Bosea sp. FBZP-16]|uniref:GIY-YIG nuclease family protein n=1 Tax=Bosea sp. FBZP-16 TaxID=2065382 RepID=UPI000C307A19|nr:GIY-YIG nuclease family protein [Bosea sp. FBZP-16]
MSKTSYVYFVGMREKGPVLPFCKIGMSDEVSKRLAQIQSGNPYECFVYKQIRCSSRAGAQAIEAAAQADAASKWRRGEWFNGTPEAIYRMVEASIKTKTAAANDNIIPAVRRKLSPAKVSEILTRPKPGGLAESLRRHMEAQR